MKGSQNRAAANTDHNDNMKVERNRTNKREREEKKRKKNNKNISDQLNQFQNGKSLVSLINLRHKYQLKYLLKEVTRIKKTNTFFCLWRIKHTKYDTF